MTDSFKARTTLKVGARAVRNPEPRRAQVAECRPPALFPEDSAGKSPALRRRRQCHQERHRGAAEVGSEGAARVMRSPSRPRGSSCRTSPAFPASSTWRPCAKPSCGWAAIRSESIRWRPPNWSSITRCRSTNTAPPIRSSTTTKSNSTATASATCSCAGARRHSATSRWCRPTPASSTRSTSSVWRG